MNHSHLVPSLRFSDRLFVLLRVSGVYGESLYPAGPVGGWTARFARRSTSETLCVLISVSPAMYVGHNEVDHDAMIFVSGATVDAGGDGR